MSEGGDISQVYCCYDCYCSNNLREEAAFDIMSCFFWELWNPIEKASTQKAHKFREWWELALCWQDSFQWISWNYVLVLGNSNKTAAKYWEINYSDQYCSWQMKTVLSCTTLICLRNQEARTSSIFQANISFSNPINPPKPGSKSTGCTCFPHDDRVSRNRLDKRLYFTQEQLPILHELPTCQTELTGSKSLP